MGDGENLTLYRDFVARIDGLRGELNAGLGELRDDMRADRIAAGARMDQMNVAVSQVATDVATLAARVEPFLKLQWGLLGGLVLMLAKTGLEIVAMAPKK